MSEDNGNFVEDAEQVRKILAKKLALRPDYEEVKNRGLIKEVIFLIF